MSAYSRIMGGNLLAKSAKLPRSLYCLIRVELDYHLKDSDKAVQKAQHCGR